ncbi:hypothetical protein MRX96_037611 [Rhipicephalus microplus]
MGFIRKRAGNPRSRNNQSVRKGRARLLPSLSQRPMPDGRPADSSGGTHVFPLSGVCYAHSSDRRVRVRSAADPGMVSGKQALERRGRGRIGRQITARADQLESWGENSPVMPNISALER